MRHGAPSQPGFQPKVGGPVAAVAVGPVVFLVVGDGVVECEAVMAGDVVDGFAHRVEPEHQRADHPGIAADEPADVVPEPAVPLAPPRPGEPRPEQIRPAGIPGLGDQVDVAEDRVGADRGQERGVGRFERAVGAAGQHGGKVEAEAVVVHLRHPGAARLSRINVQVQMLAQARCALTQPV